MSDIAIEFKNVTKSYSISRHKYRRISDDISLAFKKVLTKENRSLVDEKFLALKKVSFKVEQGVNLGIIGKNGAGKSTILKLISKITYPDYGEITVNGKIGAFIELGAGLHPKLSGRENIYLYGAILGMRKKEVDEKFRDIVNFSELEKFLDTPIKRYSSGMYARLGFSVVSFMNPDILLIDEVLAVGDKNFQEKCLQKMEEFAKGSKSIVFISHNLEAVRKLCTRVILLDQGTIVAEGNPEKVINIYTSKYANKTL